MADGSKRPNCVVCDAPDAGPAPGFKFPLCNTCEGYWQASSERARAATARDDFVRRRRKELGK